MMRRAMAWLLACLLVLSAAAAAADSSGIDWTGERRARLRVGNPTALRGRFFTTMWGGTTSDLDVQDLLHGYSPVCYDMELSRFCFNHSVVQEAVAMDDEDGRTYLLVFYDDLYWSDGTPITAADYAFSILFCMDPAIRETGGNPMDFSWIAGSDEYLDHTEPVLSGLRIVNDRMLQVRAKADSLPYFHELSRLMIYPYPASVIAPGISVLDEGNGARLSEELTADMINQTVLDPSQGYMSHPSTVSGPYVLTEYRWPTAKFTINPYFKGTEDGTVPRIGELEYTLADNDQMIESLVSGEYGLLNKVTLSENVRYGIRNRENENYAYMFESYARSGLTLLWFMESSPKLQEEEVRKAIAYCFDREGFTLEYAGPYGMKMDGFYGLRQWMFRLASGQMPPPVDDTLPEAERRAAEEAFEGLNLDGLARYTMNIREAERLLNAAGWKKNEQGVRCKTMDGKTEELRLVLGIPESEAAEAALETHFIRNLKAAGIAVTIQRMSSGSMQRAYQGESNFVDLLYLGENFSIIFDAGILKPASGAADTGLAADKAELYAMAAEMERTDPNDLSGYLAKWIALQQRITETLPLLPIYSNIYFDFYTRELHDYRITQAITWGEAIVGSYMSDKEKLEDEDIQNMQDEMAELEQSFGSD